LRGEKATSGRSNRKKESEMHDSRGEVRAASIIKRLVGSKQKKKTTKYN